MKSSGASLIKDLIISILIVIVVVLIFSVVFYDKISFSKVIPQSEEYKISDEMQEDLSKTYNEENTEVITTYHIDAADLKKYESTKEYTKGKKNPFAVESDTANNTITGSTPNEEPSPSTSNTFYPDDGTK